MKKLITTLLTVGLLAFAATTGFAQTAPTSVIHVVTVKFKADGQARPDQGGARWRAGAARQIQWDQPCLG